MTSSNEAHDKSDPFSKLFEQTLLKKFTIFSIGLVAQIKPIVSRNEPLVRYNLRLTTALRAFHYGQPLPFS